LAADGLSGLREEIEGYLSGLQNAHRRSRVQRMRPCKPSTIRTWMNSLKIVQRLQHQHPKHHDDVDRFAAGAALLLLRGRQNAASIRAETLKRHHPIDHLQRIALCRNHRKALVRIKKARILAGLWPIFERANARNAREYGVHGDI
jgi:hypothetical protein